MTCGTKETQATTSGADKGLGDVQERAKALG